jgi:hypothetical protein
MRFVWHCYQIDVVGAAQKSYIYPIAGELASVKSAQIMNSVSIEQVHANHIETLPAGVDCTVKRIQKQGVEV